jgi:hypothetical protein
VVQQQQQFAVLELWQFQLLLLELWPTFVPSTGSAASTNEAQYLSIENAKSQVFACVSCVRGSSPVLFIYKCRLHRVQQ